VIRNAILEEAEQILMEAVAGMLSLRQAGHWDWNQFQAAVSKEALTTAVMVRFHAVQTIEEKIMDKVRIKS
jgi:hypothetical protein